jgi:hypothetical protein
MSGRTLPKPVTEPAPTGAKPPEPAPAPKPVPTDPATTPKVETPPAKTDKPAKPTPNAAGKTSAAEKPAPSKASPLTFSASGMAVVGLGYDAVSGRFLVGDRQERRLLVLGERSGRLASLAGTDAGFSDVTAFEIDVHEGDLWVVSASDPLRSSTVHKLQLISGRVLSSIALPENSGPARFTDVAVTPQNILVLDSDGRRVFRVAKKGRSLELAARLAVADVTSLTASSDATVYGAYDRGLVRIDLSTRTVSVVEPHQRTDLSGLAWIRWFRGSLVAIQKGSSESYRLLRIRLDDAGKAVRAVDVLEETVALAGPTSATIAGNVLYYLGRSDDKDALEVKKLTLK